jgi:hypothetical protein
VFFKLPLHEHDKVPLSSVKALPWLDSVYRGFWLRFWHYFVYFFYTSMLVLRGGAIMKDSTTMNRDQLMKRQMIIIISWEWGKAISQGLSVFLVVYMV